MDTKKPIILNDLEEWDFTDYVDALIDKEEAVDLEFKIAKDGLPNSLWDTYSSFANTDGGVIVLGVKEHKQQLIIEGLTRQQISQYKKDFWNQINNPDCVNENLLTDDDLYEGSYGNKELLLIYVPRANRAQRPVYRTRNPFNLKPSHPWLNLKDLEFLTKLEAYRKDRTTKEEGFTLAGILMFGKTESITDPECAPNYFPDYREHLNENSDIRWTDRICPDGTWEANLFQFYRRVHPKLTSPLPKPFILINGIRIDETPTHVAVREAFINTLIHCDFSEEGNIVVEQWVDKYRFKNPGTMLVSKAQYYLGGDSVCRNKALQKMFMLIGFSEKAGSGVNKIIKGWREANWQKPYVEEFNRPDKVELTLPMISLLPDDAVIKLKELFDGKVESLTQDELTALVTCFSEGEINNTQLQYVIPQHRSDITRMLKKLCNQGFLVSEGNGRGTKYHVYDPERKVGTSEDKVGTSGRNMDSSEVGKVGTSNAKVGTSKRLKFEELESIIISIAEDYTTLDEIASGTNRTFDYIANKIIPRMLKNGTIEYLYPGVPNHPKQKYKATNKKL